VKSAKFHTCSQTTASMRSKPDVHAQVFDPVFLAPGLRHDRVQAGIGVGADGVADDVDSASSSGMAGAPTSFVNGRRQYAPTTSTLTAAVKTAKAQPNLDVPYRPAQVDDNQATPRFCLLGALSGRSAGRPLAGVRTLACCQVVSGTPREPLSKYGCRRISIGAMARGGLGSRCDSDRRLSYRRPSNST
jgi:hypothetical protein